MLAYSRSNGCGHPAGCHVTWCDRNADEL